MLIAICGLIVALLLVWVLALAIASLPSDFGDY